MDGMILSVYAGHLIVYVDYLRCNVCDVMAAAATLDLWHSERCAVNGY